MPLLLQDRLCVCILCVRANAADSLWLMCFPASLINYTPGQCHQTHCCGIHMWTRCKRPHRFRQTCLPCTFHSRCTHAHAHVPGSVQRCTAPFRFTPSGIMSRIMRNIHHAADLSEFDLYLLGIFLGVCHALFGFGYCGDNNVEKKIE